MNKKIGIVGWKVGDNSFGITLPYAEYLSRLGELVIIHPNQEVIQDLDLLVLPGGADVDPGRYNQIPSLYTGNPNVLLEFFDRVRLPEYIKLGTNILGICRGMQSLAVHFGASLIQEIGAHEYSTKDRSELVHKVFIEDTEFPSEFLTKGKYIETNSLHHQAVDESTITGTPVMITGRAEDKTVETIKIIGHNIVGVQFHPEHIFDDYTEFYLNKFLKLM
jgi:putative glutamine amidotransferase